jgi:GT2 family glycosyltransferase
MQKKINYKDITIILVAYYPDYTKLMDLIKSINDNFKIIIIQNCKSELGVVKRIHKNVEIIKNRINSGNGAAINIGLKKTFTKFCLYLDIDIVLEKNFLKKLINNLNNIENFSILLPNINKKFKSNKLIEIYKTEGSVMLFNMKDFKKEIKFNKKFFLYYEEIDVLYRCKKTDKKVYVIPNLFAKHQSASSIQLKNQEDQIRYLRDWHYMWSKFYFYKIHFNYLLAIKKTYLYLIKDIVMAFVFLLKNNKFDLNRRIYRIFGLICSWVNTSSFLRVKIIKF